MQQTHCAKRSLCEKAIVQRTVCKCTTNDYVTVTFSNHATVKENFVQQTTAQLCSTTVLHKCAQQLCSTTVLHNCAPQLCSTRAFLSSPLCSLCSPASPSALPSSSPNSVSPQSLAPVQAVRAGMGRNWESFQSLEYKSKSKSDLPIEINLTGIGTFR